MRGRKNYSYLILPVSLLLIVALTGCNSNESAKSVENRPTDLSEGLPGYIVAPEKVHVEVSDTSVTFSAQEGAVTTMIDDEPVQVSFWNLDTADMTIMETQPGQTVNIPSTALNSVDPEVDGSVVPVSFNRADLTKPIIAVSISRQSTPNDVVVPSSEEGMITVVSRELSATAGTPFTPFVK